MSDWISVEERRPDEFYDEDGGMGCIFAYAPNAENLPNMQTCNVRFFNVGGRDYFSHWMPLPAPPEDV